MSRSPNSGSESHSNLVDSEDRITELPDCIIEQILSFLPIKDAVKTGALSKRWANLWTTIPCLSFQQLDFQEKYASRYFTEFVTSTLACHRGWNVDKFALSFCITKKDKYYCPPHMVDQWIDHLMTLSNLKELNLNNLHHGDPYQLPPLLYSNNTTLTKLELCNCILNPVGAISWSSLKSLSIGRTYLDEDLMRNVIEGCPLLECLELYEFCGVYYLNFTNSRLIKLVLRDMVFHDIQDCTLHISAPYLRCLALYGEMEWCNDLRVLDAKSLVDCSLNFFVYEYPFFFLCDTWMLEKLFKDTCYAKELALGAWFIQILTQMAVILSHSCPLLEYCRCLVIEISLKKWDLPGIANLLRSTTYLEKLIINLTAFSIAEYSDDEDDETWPYVEEHYSTPQNWNFKCLMLHLKTVKITGVVPKKFGELVVPLVHCLVKNARVLENITIKAGEDVTWKELFLVDQTLLSDLPTSSPSTVLTFLE